MAKVEVPNPGLRLLPGMIASVSIDQPVAEDTVVIPQDFLVTRLDNVGVFLVDDEGRAAWRPVQAGLIVRDQVIVEAGLEPGDQVVMSGHRGLADGDPLIIARTGTCCTHGRVTW
jgi:multidrug efflux pump subunit AcrA (membrane-fusion protein)